VAAVAAAARAGGGVGWGGEGGGEEEDEEDGGLEEEEDRGRAGPHVLFRVVGCWCGAIWRFYKLQAKGKTRRSGACLLDQVMTMLPLAVARCLASRLPLLPLLPGRVVKDEKRGREGACRRGGVVVG